MPKIIEISTYKDDRGSLSIIEKILPFSIKRVYYIYDTSKKARGGHRHKKTIQFLVCISGSCNIICYEKDIKRKYVLDKPNLGLIIYPDDFHIMDNFSRNSVLLVLASEYFNKEDYIDEKNN